MTKAAPAPLATEAQLDVWMGALACGDRAAFEPLYRALAPRARGFFLRRMPANATADCTQTVLMNLFARAHEFTPGRRALPWFYAACANEARRFNRRRGREEHGEVPEVMDEAAGAEDLLIRHELHLALARAIEDLDGLAAEAIAWSLGFANAPDVPAPTFRKRVSRAYAHLRSALGGDHDE